MAAREHDRAGSLLWLEKEAQASRKLQMAAAPATSLHTNDVSHNLLTWCYPGGGEPRDSHTSSAASVSLL